MERGENRARPNTMARGIELGVGSKTRDNFGAPIRAMMKGQAQGFRGNRPAWLRYVAVPRRNSQGAMGPDALPADGPGQDALPKKAKLQSR